MPGHRARRHGKGTGQVHLPWPTTPRKIPVLRADYYLLRPRRHSRPGVDARAATRLDHVRPSFLENVEITLAYAVVACLLRSKLDVELHRIRHPFAMLERIGEHECIHVHVF